MTTPEFHARASDLFTRARALPEPDRERLLAAADPALRDEVRSLLRFHDADATAATDAAGTQDPFTPGVAFGPYTVVRRLGRGATGVVLLAAALAGVAPELLSRGNFHGLTSSHHVVGLYFGVVAVALALAPDPTRGSLDRTLAVASAGIVVASGSRTALVGLLVAGLYAASTAPTLGRRLRNLVVTAMVVVLSLALSGRVLTTAQFLVSDDFISAAAARACSRIAARLSLVIINALPQRKSTFLVY